MSIYSPKSTSQRSKSLKNSELKKPKAISRASLKIKSLRKSNKQGVKSSTLAQEKSFTSRNDRGLEIVSLSRQDIGQKAANTELKKIDKFSQSQTKRRAETKGPSEPGFFEVSFNHFKQYINSTKEKVANFTLPSFDFKFPEIDFYRIYQILRIPLSALCLAGLCILVGKNIDLKKEFNSNLIDADSIKSQPELITTTAQKSKINKVQKTVLKRGLLPTFDTLNLNKELFHSPLLSSEIIDSENGQIVSLTLNDYMQEMAENLLDKYKVPWGAIVALDPKTGKVLTLASRGEEREHELPIALRSGFPAASLFKIVTGAAAIERKGMDSESVIKYRGGNYIVSKSNYLPDEKRDSRVMKLGRAMGKSVNPVFARLALKDLDQDILSEYAKKFGFFDMDSKSPDFIIPLENSVYNSAEDDFELARTAAGFGDVFISPVHAALLSASIANDGIMMKPYIIDTIKSKEGEHIYQSSNKPWKRVVKTATAKELSKMLEKTVESGTARKTFSSWKRSKKLKNILVSGKTGTLSGENPKGRYHWFVGTVPADAPELSIAALVVDPGGAKINGAGLARIFLEKYFLQKAKIEASGGVG